MKKRVALILAVVALLAPRARAGPDEPDPAERDPMVLLQSDRPEDVAWGAWLAGKRGVRESEPLLLRHLLPHPGRAGDEWSFAHLAVLDALVVTGARVPGEALLPHARGRTAAPALVLLSRDVPRNRDALLAIFEHHGPRNGSLTWLATGNLLAANRAKGFCALLFPHFDLELNLVVTDRANFFGISTGSAGVRFGDGVIRVPEGFPPTPVYRLTESLRAGCEELAPGPRPVYYQRTVREGTRIGTGASTRAISGTECVLEWLGALLGVGRDGIALEPVTRRRLFSAGPGTYLAQAVPERDAVLGRFWGLVGKLVKKGLLPVEEAARIEPRLRVKVSDRRTDRSTPLPGLPPCRARPDFSK